MTVMQLAQERMERSDSYDERLHALLTDIKVRNIAVKESRTKGHGSQSASGEGFRGGFMQYSRLLSTRQQMIERLKQGWISGQRHVWLYTSLSWLFGIICGFLIASFAPQLTSIFLPERNELSPSI